MSDAAFEAWVEEAKNADILRVAQSFPQLTLKKAGRDWNGPCPACGSKDSFVITPGKEAGKQFLCRKGGAGGVIAMVGHILGIEPKGAGFVKVCEEIVGRPPPDSKQNLRERDPDADRERAKQRREREHERLMAEEAAKEFSLEQCMEILGRRQPFHGSRAEEYLRSRKVVLNKEQAQDFGFIPSLAYWGWISEEANAKTVHMGDFPAMVVPFRTPAGAVTGIHITYLDLVKPEKLDPPGTSDNKAKKIRGPYIGGLIRLGQIMPVMAIGEGIETTASWWTLGRVPEGVDLDDIGIAVAGSMGNLCGQSTENVKPALPTKRKSVPNGIADMERPGFMPLPNVRGYIFLGDGDSEPEWTRRCIMTAMDRAKRDEAEAWADMAPAGVDFNDVLTGKRK
jgi:hypothetical protein